MQTASKIFLGLFLTIFIASCTKENIEAPIISDFELGVNNSNIGYIGTEIHVEGNVVAEGKIDRIEIHIHPENAPGSTWEEELVYEEFEGLKNTLFHFHLDIPASATAGTYHFHFLVIDQEGQTTEVERDLEVQVLIDNVMPVVTVSNPSNTNVRVFSNGQTISISGTITDNIGISGLYVGLVKVDQGLTDVNVTHANTITLLHTHDFDEPDEVTFNASIIVGAANDNDTPQKSISWSSGEYYLLVKAPNLGGNGAGYSAHYPVTINL